MDNYMSRRHTRILICGSRRNVINRLLRQMILAGYDALIGDEVDFTILMDRLAPDALILDGAALTRERLEVAQCIGQQRGVPVIVLADPTAVCEVEKLCAPFDDVLTCPLKGSRFLLQILSDLLGGPYRHPIVGIHPFPTRVTWPTARRLTASASR